MKAAKRRSIGVGILIAAVLTAAAFQIFGHGLIAITELHPGTSPELAAKGMDMAGGQHFDFSRLIVLSITAIVGLVITLSANRYEKPVA